MPFVSGFLRIRRPGRHPDQGLPPGEGPVDPGYGAGIPGIGWRYVCVDPSLKPVPHR
jgi:hypothetical protein